MAKTGSPPRLLCAGLPAAAGAARSRDGSCKSLGERGAARQGGGHRRSLGCKGVPALPKQGRVGGCSVVTTPSSTGAGRTARPLQGPPAQGGLGLACLCAMVPGLRPHGAASLAAPLGTALPSPWLLGCNLSAPLGLETPGAGLGLAVVAEPAAFAAMLFPSPRGLCPCQGSPHPSHRLLCPAWEMAGRHGSPRGAGGTLWWGQGHPCTSWEGRSGKCNRV